jgi:DNA-binding transcriptional MerR regulator
VATLRPIDHLDSPNQLTIEQLAAESGMSVRNIRSHQARGLLQPPEVRMRLGYYGPAHLERLKEIRQLQSEGFNLAGIKRLLEETDGAATAGAPDRLAQFKRALTEPNQERAERLTLAQLRSRFRVDVDTAAELLEGTARLGLLVPVGDGVFEAPSPTLLALAEQVFARGIPLEEALRIFEELETNCDAIARAFTELFVTQVWDPFEQAEMPAERWPEIYRVIEALRPVAAEALIATFQRRMRAHVEEAFSEIAAGIATR